MTSGNLESPPEKLVEEILGYLNFSSGAADPRFLAAVNDLFESLSAKATETAEPTWQLLARELGSGLRQLHGSSKAFKQIDQAAAVLRLVFQDVLPAYREHHKDLLFHQTDESLFQPFFLARACEVVLLEGKPWDETERIVRAALVRLNDFIGHRPVAVLEGERKLQPYDHERVRPIPLWVQGAGAGMGRYRELIEKTIEVLEQTDPDLLGQAWFDLARLEELAVDPRAYDFDHPVNRRPNYQFGQWDPHHIDNRGYYRRFVVQQVTLDAILGRIEDRGELPRDEVLLEAAVVLAGTMLMGSGVSGDGPGRHDSNMTLAALLPHIAEYRDAFYEQFLGRVRGKHRKRLRAETTQLRQPLAGARQHLNQYLSRRRAMQLQHVHLAKLYARMGYSEAAARQARVVPVASARMQSEIQCRLTSAHRQVDRGELEGAARLLSEIEDLLHRAIECGALVDPWNILGFDAQFSLFPALENSCHDQRVDELLELMEEIFALYARLEKEAAAAGQDELRQRLSDALSTITQWWDQFATTEVASVEGISGHQAWESADHVATTLGEWSKAGTAAGDVAFWRGHVAQFRSPESYALVVEALLGQHDLVSSMALLMQWLSQSDEIPLVEGAYSFHQLALRWLGEVWRPLDQENEAATTRGGVAPEQRWALTQKFMDYLEAGGEAFWQVPQLELLGQMPDDEEDEIEEEDESGGLFGAAYENVTYRDTTDDGFEGEIFEQGDGATDFELTFEAERISKRLAFLRMLARAWRLAAVQLPSVPITPGATDDREEVVRNWLAQAAANRRGLLELLDTVHRYHVPTPAATEESLIEYDRRQGIKEMLLERISVVCVETADATRALEATLPGEQSGAEEKTWAAPARRVFRAVHQGDVKAIRQAWPKLVKALVKQPLLYLPTARGGHPKRIVASRTLQHALGELLLYLPRLGLLRETCELIETVHRMERDHPVGQGGITEFDKMFESGYRAIVRCLVAAAEEGGTDEQLIDCLEDVSAPLVRLWVSHSRNIRFSPLETVTDEPRWIQLKEFIQEYGHDLFTQTFLQFGNLRAIMHQGVDAFIEWLAEKSDADDEFRLVADLDGPLSRDKAVALLGITIEAVLDNYNEYMDYNSSTTQSDRGEMLYTLLDFLRLVASYDRVAWHLDPLVLAHEVLIRSGRSDAAELWQQTFAQQTSDLADEHLARLQVLVREHGIQLRSVADRLGQRFVRPLEIGRLRALIAPAMEEALAGHPTGVFDQLQRDLDALTEEPTGVGFLVPAWLESLEEEADAFREEDDVDEESLDAGLTIPRKRLGLDEARRQVQRWGEETFDEV